MQRRADVIKRVIHASQPLNVYAADRCRESLKRSLRVAERLKRRQKLKPLLPKKLGCQSRTLGRVFDFAQRLSDLLRQIGRV